MDFSKDALTIMVYPSDTGLETMLKHETGSIIITDSAMSPYEHRGCLPLGGSWFYGNFNWVI